MKNTKKLGQTKAQRDASKEIVQLMISNLRKASIEAETDPIYQGISKAFDEVDRKDLRNSKNNMNKKPYIHTVSIDQLVNPWGGEERTNKEVEHAMKNCSANPKPIKCKKCGDMYQPHPYELIYYDLCKTCFKEFDKQKMDGRKAYSEDRSKPFKHFEDVDEWIKKGAK